MKGDGNMKKSGIIAIVTVIVACIAMVLVTIGLVYGWFLDLNKTDAIDAETKGIVFSYTITDGTTSKTDVQSYDVKNVAFFDIDGDGEGKYFSDMACEIELDVKNICDKNISVSFTFTPDQAETGPHLGGLFTSVKLSTDANIKTYNTVNALLAAKKEATNYYEFTYNSIAPEDTEKVYLYIFGIQPDDDADNTFFSSSYGFEIKMRAIKEADE